MSQIHIVIGFKTSSLQSEVEPVYVGRSGVAAEAAIKARTDLAQFHWSRGLPRGIIKRNGNIQPLVLPPAASAEPDARIATFEEAIAHLREELDTLGAERAALIEHVAKLEEIIAAAGAPTPVAAEPTEEIPHREVVTEGPAPEVTPEPDAPGPESLPGGEDTAPASPGSLSPGRGGPRRRGA